MATRIPALLAPPIGFAHRGARAHAAENTLEAFELACQMGATGIETDAWITADGEIVLHHDGTVGGLPSMVSSRRILGRPIGERAASEPSDPHPHTGRVLPRRRHRAASQCGREGPRSVRRPGGGGSGPRGGAALWACHPDSDMLTSWRAGAPDVRLVHSTRLGRLRWGPERHAADMASAGIDAVNFHREDWNGGLTTLYHRFELFAFGWDAHQTRHIAELVDSGLDAVYSDHVDRIVQVLARFAQ